jgi:2,4-dienoyl-CoA reductase-like NADH-dependent reductase (Old Yellow Enzyme family)/thioredoxin reductase
VRARSRETSAQPAPDGFDELFEPASIGGLRLKSRVLMAPMEKNLCTASGLITQRYIDYLVARASNDVGLLRVEATYVDPAGKGRPYQLGAHNDAVIPGLARMTSAIHDAGGLLSLELAHCGRQTNSRVTGRQPVAPSPIPCARSGGFMPRELAAEELAQIVARFADAARRAQRAGVDAIEIHGASGYLLNAFLSPWANRRTDGYGGSPSRRMRFPLEVVAAVRAAVGDTMPMLYRLCADEFLEGGLTTQETVPFAVALESAGVDLIDVSAGTYESVLATQPPMETPPGSLLGIAAEIKGAVKIPVSTAGKLGNLEVAARAIRSGLIDFATIARGLHADPELLSKARSGRIHEARRCIACAECVAWLGSDQPAFCAINPATARERDFATGPARRAQRVVVVGAGAAGLEAARTARLRGHHVQVFERSHSIGGQVRFASLVDGRGDFAEPVQFLARELSRLRVHVTLGTSVDADLVEQLHADAVIIATGARATPRPVPGADLPHVLLAADFLAWEEARHAEPAAPAAHSPRYPRVPVAVVGGNWVGCHVAALLLEDGYSVVIVEPRDSLAYDMNKQPATVLRERVANHPLSTVYLDSTVEQIARDHISIWCSEVDQQADVLAEAVVLVEALEPDMELADAIRARFGPNVEVHSIGDCVWPRKLQDALFEGSTVAARL